MPKQQFTYKKMLYLRKQKQQRGNSSVGRALASQAEGRGFESRLPLNKKAPQGAFCCICRREPATLLTRKAMRKHRGFFASKAASRLRVPFTAPTPLSDTSQCAPRLWLRPLREYLSPSPLLHRDHLRGPYQLYNRPSLSHRDYAR